MTNASHVEIELLQRQVAELKAENDRLKAEIEQHRRLSDTTPQIPWTADAAGRVTGFSQRWLDLTGLTRESALGHVWEQAPHADDLPELAASWQRSIQTGDAYDVEHRIRLADGQYRWMRSRAFPSRDARSEIVGWYGSTEDITERKQLESRRLEQQEWFERLAVATPDLLYLYDVQDKRNVYANREIGTLIGYTTEYVRALGSTFFDVLLHPEDRLMVEARLAGLTGLPDGAVSETEYRVKHEDGSWRWMVSRDVVFSRDSDGSVRLVLGIGRDVTEWKKQEQDLRRKESELAAERDRLAALFAQAPAFIATLSGPHLTFERANPAYYDLVGRSDLTGKPLEVALPELHAQGFDQICKRVLIEGEPYVGAEVCVHLNRRDGNAAEERYVDFVIAPLTGADGTRSSVVMIGYDVTDRVAAEQAARRSQAELTSVFEAAPVGIALVDRQLRYLHVNAAFSLINGLPVDAHAGRSVEDVLGPAAACFVPDIERVLHTNEPVRDIEIAWPPASESPRATYQLEYVPVRSGEGETTAVCCVVTDITSRKQIERALAVERARLQTVLDSAPVGILLATAPSGGVVIDNGRTKEMLQRPVFVASNLEDYAEWVAWNEDGTRADPSEYPLARAVRDGVADSRIYLCPRGDGSKAWLQFNAAPVFDTDGQIKGGVVVVLDVDSERRAQAEVREVGERFRLALEANRLGTWDWNMESNHITWGGYHYQLIGMREGEFDGRFESFLAALHPEDAEAVQREVQRVTTLGEQEFCLEYRTIWPDGSVRWLEGRARFFYGNDGRPQRMLGVVQDISGRKESEERLRSSEAEFRQIANSLPQLAWVTHANGNHEWFNRRWYEYTGASPEECSGAQWSNFFHPEDIAVAAARWSHSLATGDTYEVEYRCRRFDGVYRWFLGRAEPVHDENGRIVRWFGTCTDIDDQKKAEATLRGQQQWLEAVLDWMPIPILLIELGTARVTFANRAANQLASGEFPKGRPVEEYAATYRVFDTEGRLLNADEMPGVRLARGEELQGVEVEWETAAGRRALVIDGTILPSLYGRASAGLSTFSDITSLKTTERALRQSNEDLERFAYMASHDLQEPLRMITSYTQLLIRRYADKLDDTGREYATVIFDGTQRMGRLIQDLLMYARSTTGDVQSQPTDANIALQVALANLRPVIDDTQPCITYDQLPRVRAEESSLAQVFQNLLSNALKYRRPEAPPLIHIAAEPKGDEWVFAVRDNGQGISEEHRDRIFQLFSRLHGREVSGTGIGLTTCKRIIERFGGRIWVESEPGVESTFFFTLPAS